MNNEAFERRAQAWAADQSRGGQWGTRPPLVDGWWTNGPLTAIARHAGEAMVEIVPRPDGFAWTLHVRYAGRWEPLGTMASSRVLAHEGVCPTLRRAVDEAEAALRQRAADALLSRRNALPRLLPSPPRTTPPPPPA